MKLYDNIRGDFMGALPTSIICVIVSVGYGILLFSQIGIQYGTQGAFAAIFGAAFAMFLSATFGGTPTQISGPLAASTAILMSFTSSLIGLGLEPARSDANATTLFGWLFLAIILAGVFQFLFGIFKLGQLTKFVPHEVVTGFLSGVGLLLIISQIKPFLGFKTTDSFAYIFNHLSSIQPTTCLVGALTLIFAFCSNRIIKKVPGPIVSLIAGSLFYYLMHFLFPGSPIGAVIGDINSSAPLLQGLFNSLPLLFAIDSPNFFSFLSLTVTTAISLALIGSLQSLLSSLAADVVTGTPHKSNRELLGQGLGNITSGLFGGLHCGPYPLLTVMNIHSGGKTRLSGIFCGLMMLFYVLVGWPVLAKIPYTVLAALIIYFGYMLIEKEGWKELFTKSRTHSLHKQFYQGLVINTVVMFATVFLNISIAIALGIAIAICLFLQQMSHSVIRSQYTINQIHSRMRRTPKQEEILFERGQEGIVFQLQGSLFFASAGNLSDRVEAATRLKEINYIILDMRHLVYCDATALMVLQRLHTMMKNQNKFLLFSNVSTNQSIVQLMQTTGMFAVINKQHIFDTTDLAMEWVENQILCSHEKTPVNQKDPLLQSGLFNLFTQEEISYVESFIKQKSFKANSSIIEQNNDKDLYIVLQGQISIYFQQKGAVKENLRIIGLLPGAIFGEIAFLTGSERAASAIAVTDCTVSILTQEAFTTIRAQRLDLALKISINLSANMAYYISHMSREAMVLENL